MFLLYHAYVYLEFLILACTIYILASKVEFGEGEGKVPLDNIAKRAEEASDSGESGSHKGCVEAF